MKKLVTFYSEGSEIAADLYLPAGIKEDGKLPAIIFCHGFAGIREILLPDFAECFSANGFACLVFDYRGFGDSEGDRGAIIPYNQMRDIRNAITFMQSLENVDPEKIGLWGTSFGGANAIYTAANDERVKCITVQIAFGDGERVITGPMSEEEKAKFKRSLYKQWKKSVVNNRVLGLSPKNILADEQSQAFLDEIIKEFPKADVEIPILTMLYTMEFKPEDYIGKLNIPVLIIGAEKDTVNPKEESEALYAKANEPKELVIVPETTHYEIYKEPFFREVSSRQLEWFEKYLK